MRCASVASTSTSRSSGCDEAFFVEPPTTSSTSVPNALQPGHLPNYRPAE